MEKYYFVLTDVVKKVIETLDKLSSLFGSATLLAGVVEEFGLFEGSVQMDEDSHWILAKECRDNHCFSCADQGWAWPSFGAYVQDNSWTCSIGFGRHGVVLLFSKETGDLIEVHPDDSPSERCWGTDDYKSRVAQVLAAANTQLPERLPVEPYRAPQGSKLDGDFDVPGLREE